MMRYSCQVLLSSPIGRPFVTRLSDFCAGLDGVSSREFYIGKDQAEVSRYIPRTYLQTFHIYK